MSLLCTYIRNSTLSFFITLFLIYAIVYFYYKDKPNTMETYRNMRIIRITSVIVLTLVQSFIIAYNEEKCIIEELKEIVLQSEDSKE